jgi:N-acyl amino acid synthase of PEP-CTERM/exosortase system
MTGQVDLIEHYHEFFYVTRAETQELLDQAFKLRYEVYVTDCKYKFHNPHEVQKIEKDVYDGLAQHCLLFHKPTNKPIGYVRLIPYYENTGMLLPIENFGIKFNKSTLWKLRTSKSGEISRMTIHPLFRRRLNDQLYKLYDNQSTESKRYKINYLPVCLTMASLALMSCNKLEYPVALIERRLAVLLKKHGLIYESIGSAIEFNGIRIPFMIFFQQSYDNLTIDFKKLFKVIKNELISSQTPVVNVETTEV